MSRAGMTRTLFIHCRPTCRRANGDEQKKRNKALRRDYMRCIASEIKVLRSSVKCSLYAKMERHKLISKGRLLFSEGKYYGKLASRYKQEARFMVATKNATELDFFSGNNFSDKKVDDFRQETLPFLANLKSNAILYHRLSDMCSDIKSEKFLAVFQVGDSSVGAEQRKARIDEMINTVRNFDSDVLPDERDRLRREISSFDWMIDNYLTP